MIRIDDKYHVITRDETKSYTNDAYWLYSWWSCSHIVMDLNFNILSQTPMTIQYETNDKTKFVLRLKSNYDVFCIEDIRIIKQLKGNTVLASGACLLNPIWPYRVFRVCMLEIDFDLNTVNVLTVLPSISNNSIEKNWSFFEMKNKMYLVYTVDPIVIYEYDEKTHKIGDEVLKLQLEHDILSMNYDSMNLSNCGNPIVYSDHILFFCKVRNGLHYEYYKFKLDFQFNMVEGLQKIFEDLVKSHGIFYVNSIYAYGNSIVYGVGIDDCSISFIEEKPLKDFREINSIIRKK